MAVARTESPGLSRFVLPIAGLIGLGLCGAGILVLLDPTGRTEPPRLDLRRASATRPARPICATVRAIR